MAAGRQEIWDLWVGR